MPFEIEDDVELTAKAGGGGQGTIYPFASLAVGQSFLVPVDIDAKAKTSEARKASFAENARRVSNRLNGAKGRFLKKYPHVEIALRTIQPGQEDSEGNPMTAGVRVYRVDDGGGVAVPSKPARKAPAKAKPPKSKQTAKKTAPPSKRKPARVPTKAKPKTAPKSAGVPTVPTVPTVPVG